MNFYDEIANFEYIDNVDSEYEIQINNIEQSSEASKVPNGVNSVETISLNEDNSSSGFSRKSRAIKYCILICTILFGFADIGSDLWLMYQYFSDKQYMYGSLTLLFVYLPSLITTLVLFGLCRIFQSYWLYRILVKKKWPFIIIFIFPVSAIVIASNNLILIYNNKLNKKSLKKQIRNLIYLQYFDSFLEAAPQLTLQTYVIFNNFEQSIQDNSFLNTLRWISMGFSLLTITRVAYKYQNVLGTGINVIKMQEKATYFIYTLLLVVSRIIIISMTFVSAPIVVLSCILMHWVTIVAGMYCEDRDNGFIASLEYSMVIAPFSIFTFDLDYYDIRLCKLSFLVYTYMIYTAQSVLFTTIWFCYINLNTIGIVMYYAIPSIGVSLFILSIPFLFISEYFKNT